MDENSVEAFHVAQEKVQRSMNDIQPALDSLRRLLASYDFTKLSRDLFASYDFTSLSRKLLASYDLTKLSRDLFASYDFTSLSRKLLASYDFTSLSRKLLASYDFTSLSRKLLASYDFTKLSRDLFASYDFTKLSRGLCASYDFTSLSRDLLASHGFAEAILRFQGSLPRSEDFDWVDLPEGPSPAIRSQNDVIVEALVRVAIQSIAHIGAKLDASDRRAAVALFVGILALILALAQSASYCGLLPPPSR